MVMAGVAAAAGVVQPWLQRLQGLHLRCMSADTRTAAAMQVRSCHEQRVSNAVQVQAPNDTCICP